MTSLNDNAPTTNILITGAAGFVGPLLTSRLLNEPQYRLILTDLAEPIIPAGVKYPHHATPVKGDITSATFISTLLADNPPFDAVFLFHGIMSAGSEADYDLSLCVNVDSVRLLTAALRESPRHRGVRVIYASSQAVYGQPLPDGGKGKVPEGWTPTPQGTYGAHKLMTEVYLNEMHRRGFLDVFIARFPTISVRPGKPTQAASSFLSGIIREPMNGLECVVPIRDREFRSFLTAPSTVAENLMRVLRMESGALPPHVRHVIFPGISVSIQELMDALAKYGGEDKLALVKEVPDEVQERILRSWPQDFELERSLRLGLVVDKGADDLVKEYVESLRKGAI
ncbi:putative UDP-arabinose 4-epimerase 4 [Madurella mycetomatis]|uniref:UDP-arabinose 4-epimerase 4 n=1 Tax=Madurella mycetomatis TaxID=100816 RepID=A0A175W419_9PEZI|nr:putative UDP-arabinose 4-epimerase 4 [Madurella mycetomatis]